MGQNIEIVKLQIRRGPEAELPTLDQGEPAITTDTNKFFIGDGTTNHQLANLGDFDSMSANVSSNTTLLTNNTQDLLSRAINVMSTNYMASGSLNTYTGSISSSSNILTMSSANNDFKAGHGVAIRSNDGAKEVETLKINTGATTSGNVTITLDGAVVVVAVASGDTAIQVADKIRNVAANGDGSVINQSLSGSGWSVDTNATGSTDTLTFSHANQGTKVTGTFSGGSTGVTGTFTVTTQGANTAYFVSKITAINGTQLTLRDTYSGSSLASKRVEHDDTESIQKAINDAYTNFGAGTGIGGAVLLPPYSFPVTQVRLKSRVALLGVSWKSRLWLRGNTNNDVLVLDTANEEMTLIKDLSIDGQKPSQSSGRGISLDNTGGTGFSFYDPIHILQNVLVINTKGDGVYINGTREARLSNVYVYSADGNGFNLTPTDSFFVSCTSANAGFSGWKLNAPNSRIVTCKAYGSGRLDSAFNGDGFFIVGHRHNLANCEAQDNGRNGFNIYGGSNNIVSSAYADSNGNRTTGTSSGFALANAVSYNRIDGTAVNRTGYTYQKYGLSVNSDCTNNTINISVPNPINGEIVAGQGLGNSIAINNQLGMQSLTYASTITPTVYSGGIMTVTLTGNTTINTPASGHYHVGMEIVFILKQDATGGRVVTFASGYKTNWTPDTTANKTNVIKFRYDGANWIQTSSSISI